MSSPSVESLLGRIRDEVRREKPYVVDGARATRVKLNQNESPYDLPPDLKRELLEAFFQIPFNRYPSEQPHRLVEAIAGSIDRPAESIIVGNGSNELTYTLGLCLIEDGRSVVVPRPMFGLYETVIRLFGGHTIPVPPLADKRFDADGILEAVRDHQPDLTILTSPNNPTGRAMEFDEIRRIVEVSDGFVVVDEAYHEFNERPSALALMNEHPNVIVMRTLSKAMGLAGLRIGYLTAHPSVATAFMKSRLPFMVDPLAEHVGLTLIRHADLVRERVDAIKRQTAELAAELAALPGVETLPTDTNFILFRTKHEPGALLERLADAGVLVRNVSGYADLPGFLRVTAGVERENKAFLTALKNAL
ncbi:MAG: histidinol-phosphate transaminase [Rhodothermales bacterium]|nr:histidinol-phosphate transaminase [Rhodothermales bacterium]